MWVRAAVPPQDEEAVLLRSPASSVSSTHESMMASSIGKRQILAVLINFLHRVLLFAVPSFLRFSADIGNARLVEKQSPIEMPKKLSTEYLDGVRGLASVVVFIFHWTHMQFPGVNSGYDVKNHPSAWQLPVIRFVYSGAAMVSIFFTVSGFVLTHRFIQKMHRGEYMSLYVGLTSLAFRRALRLFLPSLASCVLAFICASFDLITIPKKVDGKTFLHGLGALFQYIDKESNPWTWDSYMKGFYNPQLWSIALEYRGSMVVFLVLLSLARSRTVVRMAVEFVIVLHAFGHKRWDVALFLAGMLIAEIDVLISESNSARKFAQRKSTKALLVLCMIVGIWLSGYPRDSASKSFGYAGLSRLWPYNGYRRRFWLGLGSILIVAPMPFLPSVQDFFNARLIRYFGKVSFALYLIHGLGNRTIGWWILKVTWQVIGKEDHKVYILSYLVSTTVYVPIIFWWSDMFWRAFDAPSTHLAKWIETKCASRTLS